MAFEILKPENQNKDGEKQLVQIGFSLPFGFENNNITNTTLDALKTNMKNLLVTNKGERLFQPNLGVNINKYLFEPFGLELGLELKEDIEKQLKLWYPFLIIKNIDVLEEPSNNLLKINVVFSYQRTPNLEESVQIELGGTGGDY
tara:strand:- start:144 stop:578 length:435 start_codon:yes stop_codon:yes gene_type:complete